MKFGWIGFVTFVFCMSLAARDGHTAIINYQFSGSIISADTELSGEFTVGNAASITVGFDTAEPDISGNPVFGRFNNGILSNIDIDGYTFTASSVVLDVFDNSFNNDILNYNIGLLTGADVGGLPVINANVSIHDDTETFLTGNTLPPIFELGDVSFAQISLIFAIVDPNTGGTIGTRRVVADINAINVSSVPLPAALPLLGGGLGLLGLLGWRRKRMTAAA